MAALSPRRAWVILWALCAVEFANFVGTALISPILPRYALEFGVSNALVGLVISVFGFARLIADVPTGYLSERFGRRILFVGGPLIVVVGTLLSGIAQSFPELLAYRFLAGIGSAAFTTVGTIMVADISTPQNRGVYMSYFQGALLVGVSVGPALGGFIAEPLGLRAPFFVAAGFTLVSALVALWLVPETRVRAASPDGQRQQDHISLREALPLLRNANFLLISSILFGIFLSRTGAQNTIVPLIGYNQAGLSESQVGLGLTLVSVLNLAVLAPAGVLTDRAGRKVAIIAGVVATGLAMATFVLSTNLALFLISAAVLGASRGLTGPAPNAYVVELAPARRQGMTLGLFRFFGDVGFVVGPVLLGWIADLAGYQSALGFDALLMLVLAGAFWLFAKETRGREAETTRVGAGRT